MSDAEHGPLLEGRLGIVVPFEWWRVPLDDDASRTAAVAALVKRRLGRDDRAARMRRDVRDDLLRASEQAAAAGGRTMALIDMPVGDVQVTGTMVVYELPGVTADRAVEDAVHRAEGVRAEVLRADLVGGSAVRVVTATEIERTDAAGDPLLPELRADYWVRLDGYSELVYMVFTSPFVPLRDGLLELFDAVVGSLHVVTGEL
ncbi:hypothetical protein [Luteimicrobium subarcticum]|uniref:Uncharacterized protein n=1 Tax=Luteimicrobium subarcticum TaxID=620910 RepID=A0A2M8WVL5_9MICO|nr:hypothetical protein [Luteimicrobium subarcticum]PJI94967.1 hypothetical protein CLV34_0819 [Luteimicrobium subarcticum]